MVKRLAFLDMDGVLTDFVGAACKAHGRPDPYLDPASLGVWDMEKLWGISAAEFWKPTQYPNFWTSLEPMSEARAIVDLVVREFGVENVAILSAPSRDPHCIPGKRDWIWRHFPGLVNNLIFANTKHFLAGPGRFLFDDRDKNVDEFRAAGGIGVMVPRKWNRMYREAEYVLSNIGCALYEEDYSD